MPQQRQSSDADEIKIGQIRFLDDEWCQFFTHRNFNLNLSKSHFLIDNVHKICIKVTANKDWVKKIEIKVVKHHYPFITTHLSKTFTTQKSRRERKWEKKH